MLKQAAAFREIRELVMAREARVKADFNKKVLEA